MCFINIYDYNHKLELCLNFVFSLCLTTVGIMLIMHDVLLLKFCIFFAVNNCWNHADNARCNINIVKSSVT